MKPDPVSRTISGQDAIRMEMMSEAIAEIERLQRALNQIDRICQDAREPLMGYSAHDALIAIMDVLAVVEEEASK